MPLLQERQSIELSFEDVSLPREWQRTESLRITPVNFLHHRQYFHLPS